MPEAKIRREDPSPLDEFWWVSEHRGQEVFALARRPPSVFGIRNAAPIKGDIGRLMPLIVSRSFQDIKTWERHLIAQDIPFLVVHDAKKKQWRLYKERRCAVGRSNLDDKI